MAHSHKAGNEWPLKGGETDADRQAGKDRWTDGQPRAPQSRQREWERERFRCAPSRTQKEQLASHRGVAKALFDTSSRFVRAVLHFYPRFTSSPQLRDGVSLIGCLNATWRREETFPRWQRDSPRSLPTPSFQPGKTIFYFNRQFSKIQQSPSKYFYLQVISMFSLHWHTIPLWWTSFTLRYFPFITQLLHCYKKSTIGIKGENKGGAMEWKPNGCLRAGMLSLAPNLETLTSKVAR